MRKHILLRWAFVLIIVSVPYFCTNSLYGSFPVDLSSVNKHL